MPLVVKQVRMSEKQTKERKFGSDSSYDKLKYNT
jgi:hypothetical protein